MLHVQVANLETLLIPTQYRTVNNVWKSVGARMCRGAPKLAGIQYYQYKGYYKGKTYFKLALRIYTQY